MIISRRQSIFKEFQKYILTNSLFGKRDNILVAVSGGADSVVLCHLLYQLGYKLGIAHCNFQLRGKESDSDERFVKRLATKLNVPFHVKKFNTLSYSEKNKISIQMAARDIRYAWFEKIREKYNYNVIAVAHHRDDEVETFLINLIRGTGIAGLHGIKAKSGNIVRPLLFTGRKEIEEFTVKNKIKYREDSSNRSIKYLRNRIRIKLIPMLKDLNPQIEKIIKEDIQRMKLFEEVMLALVEEKRHEIMKTEGTLVKLDIKKLLAHKNLSFFLYEFLRPYGFSGDIIEQISISMNTKESKQFFSSTHRLTKDRAFLIASPLNANETEQTFQIANDCMALNELNLKFNKAKIGHGFKLVKKRGIGMFDYDKLNFPLTVRKWHAGDFFYPYGMKGKKKLSDFFTDLKFSLIEKENAWLLCNKKDIIWVIGHRTDNRYKVTDKTKMIYSVELVSK